MQKVHDELTQRLKAAMKVLQQMSRDAGHDSVGSAFSLTLKTQFPAASWQDYQKVIPEPMDLKALPKSLGLDCQQAVKTQQDWQVRALLCAPSLPASPSWHHTCAVSCALRAQAQACGMVGTWNGGS